MLQKRDRLLEATAKATNVLLKVENIDEAINTALEIILEGAGCDRLKVLENSFDGSSGIPQYGSMIYVCTRPGMSIGEERIYSNWVPKEFIERYFLQGEGFCGLLEDFDEPMRSKVAGSQSQSSCIVPIRVDGHWWGILTLNYADAIQVSPAEFAVLRTIADCIGSAIQRDRTQREREQIALQKAEDLEAYNAVLKGRDRLFKATAKAANVLLTLEDFDQAVNTALQFIGEGTDCDCVVVLENRFESSSPLPSSCEFIYEWAAPGFSMISAIFGSTSLPADLLGLDFMRQYFLEGDGFGGLIEVWNEPLRSAFSGHVQSTYAVPIRVNGQWWGVLSLDYCRSPIQISTAEISVLMAIADCIGSAIQRDRSYQEREQLTQQRAAELEQYNQILLKRDQLLEAIARATKVLVTLENIDEAINTALKIMLDGIGCDHINVLENGYEPTSKFPISNVTIYEQTTPYFPFSAIMMGKTQTGTIDPAFLENFLAMGGFGGLLEEWPEPFRTAFTAIKIQATYSVPIQVNGHWWGILCLDYCRDAIQINPAEIAAVKTIADSIGSAIQRDRTQKMILQTEQTRIAELVKANTALKQSLDTLATDPDLDRFIGQILKLISAQCDSPLIEYWVHSDSTAHVHLANWQGQILNRNQIEQLAEWRTFNSEGIFPFLDIPLTVGETKIGAVTIHLFRDRSLSEQTFELVHALTQQLTLAIELSRLAEEAQQFALFQERTRMAREIHDTLAQAFGGILMQLQAVTYFATTQPEKAQLHLLNARNIAQEGLAEARRSVWTLYLETTEYEDLAQAIAKFIEQTPADPSVSINLTIDGTPYRLHPDLGLNLLRIAQESLTNALRHAHAQRVQIQLNYCSQTLQLTIQDDGCGFDPQSSTAGFGLLGMQQRATRIGAAWHLASSPSEGTTITVTLSNPVIP